MEAAGIEPQSYFTVNDGDLCSCENCEGCRAAYALHFECYKCHLLASFDADLQRVIKQWKQLPKAMRNAVVVLMESNA
jgi:hypothetical protein